MRPVTTLLLALPITALLGVSGLTSAEEKCRPRPSETPLDLPMGLTVVDGAVIETPATWVVDSLPVAEEDLAFIQLLCWEFAEQAFDVKVRSWVVSLWTAPGPDALMKSELEALVEQQEAHRAAHGVYADRLADLGVRTTPPRVAVELSGDERSWRAVATHDQVEGSCSLSYAGALDPAEAEPTCELWAVLRR